MDVMTEIFFQCWVGGLSTKSTYGNGVPLGLNPSLLSIPAADISGLFDPDTSPNRIDQLLDEGAGFIADEHIEQ